MNLTTEQANKQETNTGLVFSVNSLLSHLQRLADPRKARGVRYSLVTLLMLLILAKLGGEDSMKGMAEWVRLREQTLLRLLPIHRNRLPHQTTYERVLAELDVDELEQVMGDFFAQQRAGNLTITLDGKVLRGTIPAGETQGVHLLAAYVPDQGVVLMQVEVESKANEITAAPQLLEAIDLRECVVTGDAMFTQQTLCDQIVLAGGDYVLPVKDNHPTMRRTIADVFMPALVTPGHGRVCLPEMTTQTLTNGHGRIEYRYLTVSSQLNDYLDWPHLGQVFRLQRVVQYTATGKLTYQVVFGVTSLTANECSPERLMRILRTHWHIENRLHFVRDVTFHEDDCPIRHTKRQRILACLNNLVIGLIRQFDQFDYIPEARRFFSVNYAQALQLLLL
jgi:predicted transposase YbfD/YdcC